MTASRSSSQSPHDWWVASYLMRRVWDDAPEPSARSRCLAWENTILVQAPDRDSAYAKAMRLATDDASVEFESADGERQGHWVLEGLTHLLPVYDELGDGAEVLWREHASRTVGTVRSMIREKRDLEAFQDNPADGSLRW